MKTILKLNKSVYIVIALITSLCLYSNHSHSQTLKEIHDKAKQAKEEAKKVKGEVKKTTDEAKKVTGGGESNGNTGNNGNSSSGGGSISGGNTTSSGTPSSDQDFVKKITVSNATGRQIYLMVHIYDGKKDITYPMMLIKRIACDAGKDCVVDLVACAERSYLVLNSEGATVTKTVNERGKYVYNIQANFDDGLDRGEGKPDAFSTIVFSNDYNADYLKKSNNVVKVEISPKAVEELARKAKQEDANKDANDPTKVGTLTIVNAVGGKGKIYCVLRVPQKSTSSSYKKIEFMLGENKGDKYVIKDLRLFKGYDLRTMPESEKGKDPLNGITYIINSLSGRGGEDSFQMENGKVANVGIR
jgi:hypothetical protein